MTMAVAMLTTMMAVIKNVVTEVELEMNEDPPGGSRKRAREWRGRGEKH